MTEINRTDFNDYYGDPSDVWMTPDDILDRTRIFFREMTRVQQEIGIFTEGFVPSDNICLDAASCEEAQNRVKSDAFYGPPQDARELPWNGNVFCNPPYGSELKSKRAANDYKKTWIDKMFDEADRFDDAYNEAMGNGPPLPSDSFGLRNGVLVMPASPDTDWCQHMLKLHSDIRSRLSSFTSVILFPKGRPQFIPPDWLKEQRIAEGKKAISGNSKGSIIWILAGGRSWGEQAAIIERAWGDAGVLWFA